MQGYIGIFSRTGKLLAYSDEEQLVRTVAAVVEKNLLPVPSGDREASDLLRARRKALRRLAEGDTGEQAV